MPPVFVAQEINLQSWTATLRDVGIVGMLVLFITAMYFEKIYFAWQYRAMREDRDFWRQIALGNHETAKTAVGTLSQIARDNG